VKKFSGFIIIILIAVIPDIYSFGNDDEDYSVRDSSEYEYLKSGEELTYVVKYAFMKLGEVKFKVEESTITNGIPVIKAVTHIDSYEDLPFVSLHQIYSSFIDSTFYPQKFVGLMYREDTSFVTYTFNNDTSINIKQGDYNTQKVKLDSTILVKKRYQDGLSIFYFSRINFGKEKTINVPCFVNSKKENTVINYYIDNEDVSIDAVDYDIDCVRLDGETDFVSVYGLTGHFEGWFSNDNYHVPIIAKMNVIIGSVTLELKNWNKKLWNPPKIKD